MCKGEHLILINIDNEEFFSGKSYFRTINVHRPVTAFSLYLTGACCDLTVEYGKPVRHARSEMPHA